MQPMTRTKIQMVGTLRRLEDGGLQYSFRVGKSSGTEALWIEVLPNTNEWPSLGRRPENPESSRKDYDRALHCDPSYKQAASEFMEQQRREPKPLLTAPGFSAHDSYWTYRNKILRLESTDPEVVEKTTGGWRITERALVLLKHYVLRREKNYARAQREVEALENIEKLTGVSRKPISDSVRLFVWQRDRGQCVKCGSRERLEFDHIIPAASGGGSTERNIQLLCESCNRSKGAAI